MAANAVSALAWAADKYHCMDSPDKVACFLSYASHELTPPSASLTLLERVLAWRYATLARFEGVVSELP